jgi:hypothetical protein
VVLTHLLKPSSLLGYQRPDFKSGPDTKHDYLWSMGEATAL